MIIQVDYKALGLRISKLRHGKHITQEKLAELTGLSLQFVGNIERGASIPSVKTLLAIACALEIAPGDLFDPSFAMRVTDENVLRQPQSASSNTLTSRLFSRGRFDVEEPVFEDMPAVIDLIELDDDIDLPF